MEASLRALRSHLKVFPGWLQPFQKVTNATKQKEYIADMVKVEADKTFKKLSKQYDEDKAVIRKLAEDLEIYKPLTKITPEKPQSSSSSTPKAGNPK